MVKSFWKVSGKVSGKIAVKAGLEIERVWLLRGLPKLPEGHAIWRLDQGYLVGGDGSPMGRIRRTVLPDASEQFHLNHKTGTGLVRQESETQITAVSFNQQWPATIGRRVCKKRHRIPAEDLVWEIDEFADFSLVLAEVELPTTDHHFEIPKWLAPWILQEVTLDPQYRNYNLALQGPPPFSGLPPAPKSG